MESSPVLSVRAPRVQNQLLNLQEMAESWEREAGKILHTRRMMSRRIRFRRGITRCGCNFLRKVCN